MTKVRLAVLFPSIVIISALSLLLYLYFGPFQDEFDPTSPKHLTVMVGIIFCALFLFSCSTFLIGVLLRGPSHDQITLGLPSVPCLNVCLNP
jgi:hypothetical protein